MPFVPLSSDGVQRATTEALRAPRIQVALEPHEGGITVLAVEPTGLRPIGQFDPAAAEPYREVLTPLAEEGVLGICIAEASVTGTVLNLGPAGTCLPAGSWPGRSEGDTTPAAEPPTASARTGRLREEPDDGDGEPDPPRTPVLAATAATAVQRPAPAVSSTPPDAATVVLDPSAGRRPRRRHDLRGRPAHRRRGSRPAGGAGPARLVLAGITGLLLVGATAQGLVGTRPAEGAAVTAASPGPVPVPTGTLPGPVPVTVAVVPGAQVGAEHPAPDPAREAPPAVAAPRAPVPEDEQEDAQEDANDGADHDADDGADDEGHDEPGDGNPDDGHSSDDSDDGSDQDDAEGSGGDPDDDDSDGRSDDEPDRDRPGGGNGGGNGGGVTYRSCLDVWASGKSFVRRGEPGYSRRLDLDGDGRACARR